MGNIIATYGNNNNSHTNISNNCTIFNKSFMASNKDITTNNTENYKTCKSNIFYTFHRVKGIVMVNSIYIHINNGNVYFYKLNINRCIDNAKHKIFYVMECKDARYFKLIQISQDFNYITIIGKLPNNQTCLLLIDLYRFLNNDIKIIKKVPINNNKIPYKIHIINTSLIMFHNDKDNNNNNITKIRIIDQRNNDMFVPYDFDDEYIIKFSTMQPVMVAYHNTTNRLIIYDGNIKNINNIYIHYPNTLAITNDGNIITYYTKNNEVNCINIIAVSSGKSISMVDHIIDSSKINIHKLSFSICDLTREYTILGNDNNNLYMISCWNIDGSGLWKWYYFNETIIKAEYSKVPYHNNTIEYIHNTYLTSIIKYSNKIVINDHNTTVLLDIIKYLKHKKRNELMQTYVHNNSKVCVHLQDINDNVHKYIISDFTKAILNIIPDKTYVINDNVHITITKGNDKSFVYFDKLITNNIDNMDIINNLPPNGKEGSIISIIDHFYSFIRYILLADNKNDNNDNDNNKNVNDGDTQKILYYLGYVIMDLIMTYYINYVNELNVEYNDDSNNDYNNGVLTMNSFILINEFKEEFMAFNTIMDIFMLMIYEQKV